MSPDFNYVIMPVHSCQGLLVDNIILKSYYPTSLSLLLIRDSRLWRTSDLKPQRCFGECRGTNIVSFWSSLNIPPPQTVQQLQKENFLIIGEKWNEQLDALASPLVLHYSAEQCTELGLTKLRCSVQILLHFWKGGNRTDCFPLNSGTLLSDNGLLQCLHRLEWEVW